MVKTMHTQKPAYTETEIKILRAARRIFLQKGYSGARMQEIANEANINKALLHYYFRSKERLFQGIFSEALHTMFPMLMNILKSDLSFYEKIYKVFDAQIDFLRENKDMPLFLMQEAKNRKEFLFETLKQYDPLMQTRIVEQIQELIDKGEIRPIDPRQLLMNVISLSVFPFAGEPILKFMLHVSDQEFDDMIEARKKILPEFVINAIKIQSHD